MISWRENIPYKDPHTNNLGSRFFQYV